MSLDELSDERGQRLWSKRDAFVTSSLAVTLEVAEKLGAKVVVDAANGPTVPEPDRVLDRRGIVIVPNVLANAGGVTASYFEWVQSRQGIAWDEDEVATRLRRCMDDAVQVRFGARRVAARLVATWRLSPRRRAFGRDNRRSWPFP